MSTWFFFTAQFTLLAYAIVGGVFLAFSDFIMRSLAHTSGVGGVEAMQVINREVFRWIFMALFLGLAPFSVMVVLYSWINLTGSVATMMTLAGLIYLIGCFGVTIAFNVPMNEALAGMDVSQGATKAYWTQTYLPRWTFWNTVRATACAVSAALLLFGLLMMTQNHSA